jgi:serine/threonine protein kinase
MGAKNTTQYEVGGELYERLRVLGKGAYGKVYAMEHVATETIRVIKELHKGQILAEGQWAVDANIEERRILTNLYNCPYVCRIYGSNQDSKYLYCMLDFCHGGELAFHLKKRGRFTEEQVRSYTAMMMSCYDQMHWKYKVIHRDIKPENVLLSKEGHVRVIDFNFALVCDNDGLKVKNPEGECSGTLPYIAPEVLKCGDYDYRVDYWSLGVMAFELATGRPPFKPALDRKKQLKNVRRTSISIEIDREEKKGLTFSREFQDWLTRMLEDEPDNRISHRRMRKHKWFKGIDWVKYDSQQVPDAEVPFIPDPEAVNFLADSEAADALGLNKPFVVKVTDDDQRNFEGWNWKREDQGLPKISDAARKAKLEARAAKIQRRREKKLPDANRNTIVTQ